MKRNLEATLPSPSEMGNYHTCPAYWYLRDRLWIRPVKEKVALLTGREIDAIFDEWLRADPQTRNPLEALARFDAFAAKEWEEDEQAFVSGARDALRAWFTLYGNVVEEVTHVQHKLTRCRGKVDYIVRVGDRLRVRERKLLSPFADVDDEIAKYQMGFQPLAYAAGVEEELGSVEAVEFEFLIRSAPQRGRYKAIPASVRREPIFVEDWKKRMWEASAAWTGDCMLALERELQKFEDVPFEALPRHTRNCLIKLGSKTYDCDYYKACKVNMNPLELEDYYQEGEE